MDAAPLRLSRESLQDLEWLIDSTSEKNRYDFEYGVLIITLESRSYYLFSPDVHRLLIPAFTREMEGLLSTTTNGFFYTNLLDLGNFLAYFNPIEARKLELLDEEQEEYIDKYLFLIKELLGIIGNGEEIENLMLNKYWQRYVSRLSSDDKTV